MLHIFLNILQRGQLRDALSYYFSLKLGYKMQTQPPQTHTHTQMEELRSERVVRKKEDLPPPIAAVERTALPCRTHYNGRSLKGARMGPVQSLSDTGKGRQV